LRLDGDPAEQTFEVVPIKDGLGQAADGPEVAVNAPGGSGSGNRHAAPSKRAPSYAHREGPRTIRRAAQARLGHLPLPLRAVRVAEFSG
jgi:hypothetical protein